LSLWIDNLFSHKKREREKKRTAVVQPKWWLSHNNNSVPSNPSVKVYRSVRNRNIATVCKRYKHSPTYVYVLIRLLVIKIRGMTLSISSIYIIWINIILNTFTVIIFLDKYLHSLHYEIHRYCSSFLFWTQFYSFLFFFRCKNRR